MQVHIKFQLPLMLLLLTSLQSDSKSIQRSIPASLINAAATNANIEPSSELVSEGFNLPKPKAVEAQAKDGEEKTVDFLEEEKEEEISTTSAPWYAFGRSVNAVNSANTDPSIDAAPSSFANSFKEKASNFMATLTGGRKEKGAAAKHVMNTMKSGQFSEMLKQFVESNSGLAPAQNNELQVTSEDDQPSTMKRVLYGLGGLAATYYLVVLSTMGNVVVNVLTDYLRTRNDGKAASRRKRELPDVDLNCPSFTEFINSFQQKIDTADDIKTVLNGTAQNNQGVFQSIASCTRKLMREIQAFVVDKGTGLRDGIKSRMSAAGYKMNAEKKE